MLGQYLSPVMASGRIKPLLECAAALKNVVGREEVEEGPEFRELILQWGPGQEDPSGGHVVRVEDLSQLAVVILHSVAFVHYVFHGSVTQEEAPTCGERGKHKYPQRPVLMWKTKELMLGPGYGIKDSQQSYFLYLTVMSRYNVMMG